MTLSDFAVDCAGYSCSSFFIAIVIAHCDLIASLTVNVIWICALWCKHGGAERKGKVEVELIDSSKLTH